MKGKMTAAVFEELYTKFYSDKMCGHCKKKQPVIAYEKDGVRYRKLDGDIISEGFEGLQICSYCKKVVELNGNND